MKKRTGWKRILLLGLVLSLLLGTVGCRRDPSPDEDDLPALLDLIRDGATSYSVVRPELVSTDVRQAVINTTKALRTATGVDAIEIFEDYVEHGAEPPTDTPEILIGLTNRQESIDAHATLDENEYIIAMMGQRLVIVGYDDAATIQATEHFINEILPERAEEGAFSMPADFSLKNTYTPPLVNPFGEDLPIYPEQNQLTVSPASYVKPTYTLRDGMYIQRYEGFELEGVRTTFQTNTPHDDRYHVHSDSVMVYSESYANFASWYSAEDYVVDMMLAINRATKTYVSEHHAEDAIQMTSSGSYLEHSAGGSYYMVPTEEWIDYLWDNVLEPIIIACHPQSIAMEEPEMWSASGYSESFKREWEAYYGEPWQRPDSSAENMLKANLLKTYLFERIITELSARIKKLSPTTQVYIATHSTVNYADWNIDAGLNHYVATGALDGVIGQTWSDTQNTAFPYRGGNFTDNFTNAFLEYSSYVDSVEGLNFYALADPMMDNATLTEEDCQYFYRQSITASLLQPEIQRFQILPWVQRAFGNVSSNYRAIQSQIYEALNMVGGAPVEIQAGTPGITYLISDSLSWMNEGNNWALTTTNGLYGTLAPLVRDGIPTKMKSMDQIKSAADLEGVTLLIVSFDANVPLYEEINIAIADWVKAGGTLLLINGSNEYWDVESYFFWQQDGTPLNNLFRHLGLSDIKATTVSGNQLTADERDLKDAFGGKSVGSTYRRFVIGFEGASSPLLSIGDHTVGFEESVGKGNVIAVGLPSAYFAGNSSGPEMMRALTEYALQYTDCDYVTSELMVVRRGNVVAAHAYEEDQELEGIYINLYSPELTVLIDPTIKKDDSMVFYDITDTILPDAPTLAFTGGNLVDGTLSGTADTLTYQVTGAANTQIASRILLPNGVYPGKVTITRTESGEKVKVLKQMYDEQSGSLLVVFDGAVEASTLTLKVTSDKGAMVSVQKVMGETNIPVSGRNEDEKYLIYNTASSNDNLRYCDLKGELIYLFDVTEFENPEYQFYIQQNYIVEISPDGENWTMIADYSQGGTVEHIKTADNATVISIDPASYEQIEDVLYVRLRNTNTSMGWGAALTRIIIRYLVDSDEVQEINQAPGRNNTTTEVVPTGSAAENEKKYIVSTSGGVATYRRTVLTNNQNQDEEFIDFNTAGADSGCRFCDLNHQLIYVFDVEDMLSGEFTFHVYQNYILEVSADGEEYEIIADYSQGGTVPHLTTGGNSKAITVDIFDYDVDETGYLYVRLRNSDVSKGWGGSITKIELEYTKAVD